MGRLISWDQQLLLVLNGSDSCWLDNVMWALSNTWTWMLLLAVLLYKVLRAYSLRQFIVFCCVFALVILLADMITSGIIKPLVHRPRPTHEVAIMQAVDVVRGYRGGMYGFVSSHAANTFALATYVSLIIRRRWFAASMFLWAALVSYSRIYLGVHYPGDVLCGALIGIVVGYLCYTLFAYLFCGKAKQVKFSFRPSCPEACIHGSWVISATLFVTLLCICCGIP